MARRSDDEGGKGKGEGGRRTKGEDEQGAEEREGRKRAHDGGGMES